MSRHRMVWVVVAAFCAAGGFVAPANARQESIPMFTPMGVTIQTLSAGRQAGGYGRGQTKQAFGDARGMTLYTTDKDVEPGKSSCYDACAEAWPPLIAAADATPFGDWSIIVRTDGAKQWAFRSKPLYTFAKDVAIGSANGIAPPGGMRGGAGAGAAGGAAGAAAAAKAPAAPTELNPWHVAEFQSAEAMPLPLGIATGQAPDANGLVLTDINQMTLYAYDGDPNRDRPTCGAAACPSRWTPVTTAYLANPVGDFTLISRKDGHRQWAYKGQALYTFDGDLSVGDANGIGVDKRWQVALLKRQYLPPQARIQETVGRGKVLATADGMTLYRRNSYTFQVSGHSLPRGIAILPAVGRMLGTKTCEGECLKTWIPFKAAADAQPSGFWEIVTGADGSRQWSYKGYALYRFAGDKKPGDINGIEHYDIFTNNDVKPVANDGASEVAAQMQSGNQTSLYWSHMYP